MKNFLLSILLLTGLSTWTHAQISIVPKAGMTISGANLHETFYTSRGSYNGFSGGIGLNFAPKSEGIISFQPELLFTQKGYRAGYELLDENLNARGRFAYNYLELPLLVKLTFGSQKTRFYALAGPGLGYLLDGNLRARASAFGVFGYNFSEKLVFKENPLTPWEVNANRFEFSLHLGAGVGYMIGNSNTMIFLEPRFNLGLTDFDRDRTSKHRVFSIMAGVQLPLR